MESYLLINTETPWKDEVKKELSQFEFTVEEIDDILGSSDILAKVNVDNKNALKHFVLEQLERISGIKRVLVI